MTPPIRLISHAENGSVPMNRVRQKCRGLSHEGIELAALRQKAGQILAVRNVLRKSGWQHGWQLIESRRESATGPCSHQSGPRRVPCRLRLAKHRPAITQKRSFLNGRRPFPSGSAAAPGPKSAERVYPVALTATDGALWTGWCAGNGRRRDQLGTLIRHARVRASVPVGSLTQEVSLFSLLRVLMTTICRTPLASASFRSAGLAAVTLTPVAVVAHIKERATAGPTTEAWSERCLRHRRINHLDSAPHLTTIHRIDDDRTDECACGADDVAGPLIPAEVQKKTFSDDR